MHIDIGGVRTLSVEGWEITPDDRQETVEILGGMAVQDYGHIEAGDKIGCTVTVSAKGWQIIKQYWDSRQLVDVEDEAGIIHRNLRVVVKSWRYVHRFPDHYDLKLEFWRL